MMKQAQATLKMSDPFPTTPSDTAQDVAAERPIIVAVDLLINYYRLTGCSSIIKDVCSKFSLIQLAKLEQHITSEQHSNTIGPEFRSPLLPHN